jgi:hypothetical protein
VAARFINERVPGCRVTPYVLLYPLSHTHSHLHAR